MVVLIVSSAILSILPRLLFSREVIDIKYNRYQLDSTEEVAEANWLRVCRKCRSVLRTPEGEANSVSCDIDLVNPVAICIEDRFYYHLCMRTIKW